MARPNGSEPTPPAGGHGATFFADPMPAWAARYDSHLRFALALIERREWVQLAARTGVECFSEAPQYLSLFVELTRERFDRAKVKKLDPGLFTGFQMELSEAYLDEFEQNPALTILPVRIALAPGDPSQTANGTPLDQLLRAAAESGFFSRLRGAIPHGRCLEGSLAALELPTGSAIHAHVLTGRRIVVGIVDDGCAFAHPDFLEIRGSGATRTYRTRVLALWDQSRTPTPEDQAVGWTAPAGYSSGRELRKPAIDAAIAAHSTPQGVDEDAVYAALRYEVGDVTERATHGTKVMGIAASNGNSMMGRAGIAPRADIVFVQLPPAEIATAPKTLSSHIVEGVSFVFKRTRDFRRQAAVVNVSYGGYSGAHDGTSGAELHLDQMLAIQDRAVVVSAGNGFEADCHATGTLQPGQQATLHWILNDGDATYNDCEVWYNGDATLTAALTVPDGSEVLGPYGFLPANTPVTRANGEQVGLIEHVAQDASNGDNVVHVGLGQTLPDPANATKILAPAGRWTLTLANAGQAAASFHAWIHRDDLGADGLRQQSRFDSMETHPAHTISDLAGGKLTIAAGAFNAATSELCPYSACGPTRGTANNPRRTKPEICAPAEELALGGGVLTSASRSARPGRMNGTSASAPHVAGIVALAFDLCRNHQKRHLTAAQLRLALAGQTGSALVPNRRAAQDDRAVKQKDVWNDLVGAGKISAAKTLGNL